MDNTIEDNNILALSRGDKNAFSWLFRRYYKDLVLFGGNYLSDKDKCEDIVQNIFYKLWVERASLSINTSFKSFLLKSVQNACLDELRHLNIIRKHENYTQIFCDTDDLNTDNYILYSDLQDRLKEALEKLPEPSREAFKMNRFDGLKYSEIANKLEVSERTVEVRIGKALALLREYLKEFFLLIITFFSLKL